MLQLFRLLEARFKEDGAAFHESISNPDGSWASLGRSPRKDRRRLPVFLLGLMVCVFFGTFAAGAQDSLFALRCSGRLVRIGDFKVDALAKCGPPHYEQFVGDRKIRTRFGHDKLIMEDWIYNFGPTAFIHILRFERGRLVEILRGERGY